METIICEGVQKFALAGPKFLREFRLAKYRYLATFVKKF